jgi:hypothetical protein
MTVCSYFWGSEIHLSNLAFGLEIFGCVIEIIVGIVIVATFHKEFDEHSKKRLEFQFELGFLMAAFIALVAIISNRRIDKLRELGEVQAKQEINNAVSNAVAMANEAHNAASNAISAAAQNQPRHITPEQRAKFLELVKNAPKGPIGITMQTQSVEAKIYAKEIQKMLIDAGYDAASTMGFSIPPNEPQVKGMYLGVANPTNLPPHAEPFATALEKIGVVFSAGKSFRVNDVAVMISVWEK